MYLITLNMLLCYEFFMAVIKIDEVHGILGGRVVTSDEAPFQANYADICGAVLIQSEWAITSAHCGSDGTFIRVGSRYRLFGAKIQIRFHKIHPLYGLIHDFDYDVQLLKLYRSLKFGSRVKAVPFCIGSCGEIVKVFGWGYSAEKGDYSDVLKAVVLKVMPMDICQDIPVYWYNQTLTPRMFCAGLNGKDACQGDSGGAAISYNRLVGLSSFGFGCNRNIPGVYINLTHPELNTWIFQVINDI